MATTTADAAAALAAGLVTHRGSCHCKAVRFEFEAAADLVATDCNCSICHMKKNVHTIIPKARFRLLEGKDELTLYTFGTHTAQHLFCKHCGVQAFYIPRSNPDGYAVTVTCVEPDTIASMRTVRFDGSNWEQAYASSDISKYSKE